MVHGDGRSDECTLADWVLSEYPDMRDIGEPWEYEHAGKTMTIYRPGIVHRLDKDTSGIMVLVKNKQAYDFLKNAFKERNISKTYHAFVYEWPGEISGIIDAPIGRHPKDFRARSAGKEARGTLRDAVTQYQVHDKYLYNNERYAYLSFSPQTGRTHQIRVHAKHIHHPLVADTLYGGKRAQSHHNLGFTRHALHAHTLSFVDHENNERTYEAPLPEDFQNAQNLLAKKASL